MSAMTPEQESLEIARVVSDALKAAGISQRRAAAQTGIPLSTLRRRLKDAAPLLVNELEVLAELLDTKVSTIMRTAEAATACEIVWDTETAQRMDEMVERTTGHPCRGSVGGDCPVLPRSISSIAKQHADPRAVIAYAEQ